MNSREIMLYLSLKFNGEWSKIIASLQKHEYYEEEDVKNTIGQFKGNYLTILDDEYPDYLKQIQHPPFVLFYEGNLKLLADKNYTKLAISNSHSDDGKPQEYLNEFIDDKIVYVVGGTTSADEYIAMNSKTPSIIITGYPLGYFSFQVKDIVLHKNGLIMSEFPDTAYQSLTESNLMSKYRIMAGISEKLLVLNSTRKSGGLLLTMHMLDLGKDVMVIPQDISNKESVNNELIYSGADVVYDHDTFIDMCYN